MSGFSEAEQQSFAGAPLTVDAALTATLRLGPGGRVVIPANMREAMGLKQGDALVAKLSGGELTLVTLMGLVRELQTITNKHVPEGVSVVDEFIADRRAEAARELED